MITDGKADHAMLVLAFETRGHRRLPASPLIDLVIPFALIRTFKRAVIASDDVRSAMQLIERFPMRIYDINTLVQMGYVQHDEWAYTLEAAERVARKLQELGTDVCIARLNKTLAGFGMYHLFVKSASEESVPAEVQVQRRRRRQAVPLRIARFRGPGNGR